MKKALLVMDMQNACVGKNPSPYFKYEIPYLMKSVNAVISQYEPNNVYYIQTIMNDNFINKFAPVKVFEGSLEAELAEGLSVVSVKRYIKYKGNAFTNLELKKALKHNGIDEIEIIGIDGGGCVGITALGAIKEGFKIVLNTKAIGTMYIKRAEKLNKKLRLQGAVFI